MLIPAVTVKDPQKKNDLIHYANSKGCKVIYSPRYDGMAIEANDLKKSKEIKEIKEKIKELSK